MWKKVHLFEKQILKVKPLASTPIKSSGSVWSLSGVNVQVLSAEQLQQVMNLGNGMKFKKQDDQMRYILQSKPKLMLKIRMPL